MGSKSACDPVILALEIPSIFEQIIELVIYEGDGIVGQMLSNVRLVSFAWLACASKIMLKNGSAYEFGIQPDESLKKVDNASKKRIVKYIKCFKPRRSLEELQSMSIIPTKINLPVQIFQRRYFQLLLALLKKCERLIIELNVVLPLEDCILGKIGKPLELSTLRNISIRFENGTRAVKTAQKTDWDHVDLLFTHCPVGLGFFQSVLNGCHEELKCFEILSSPRVPAHFGRIILPASLEYVNFDCILGEEHVDLFRYNNLPNLTSLSFTLGVIPIGEQISSLVELSRNTLKHLQINGSYSDGIVRQPSLLTLPICRSLESIQIDSSDLKVMNCTASLTIACKRLQFLQLSYQRPEFIAKWLRGAKFINLKTVSVTCIDAGVSDGQANFNVPVGENIVKHIHIACPSLKKLAIGITFDDLTALDFIFRTMAYLEELRLDVFGEPPSNAAELIESTFLGIPQQPSVINLNELKFLMLITPRNYASPVKSLVTRRLVVEGFDRMTMLTRLSLFGKFSLPSYIMESWSFRFSSKF